LPVTGQMDENLVRALRPGEFDHPPPKDSFVTPVPSASASPAAPKQESPPVALWVKGKEGQQVLSPFTGGVVDVSGFPPGSEARCPYSGKIFLVPTKPWREIPALGVEANRLAKNSVEIWLQCRLRCDDTSIALVRGSAKWSVEECLPASGKLTPRAMGSRDNWKVVFLERVRESR
jgi:hypothetical protein